MQEPTINCMKNLFIYLYLFFDIRECPSQLTHISTDLTEKPLGVKETHEILNPR